MTHTRAVLVAFLVTFLWSTSWVLIKIGLQEVPALPFAGLRYLLAFLMLLPAAVRPASLAALRRLPARRWGELILLGLVLYAVTQGAQYLSLVFLPAATASLMLNFSAILVAFMGVWFLGERPTWLQWAGMGLYLAGVLAYFYPVNLPQGQVIGLASAGTGVLSNALAAVLGRHINRRRAAASSPEGAAGQASDLSPLSITTVSMGAGSLILFAAGLVAQGLPRLSLQGWAILLWLAGVNSALAFTLWNHTLRTLTAMESSLINNTMLFQIALLAWAFLGEALSRQKIAGLLLAGMGTIVVQWKRQKAIRPATQ
jgi:drug/metabolite transporter (DMT)-like permease